jgi:tetratricopeptide (TPR) repeat protein
VSAFARGATLAAGLFWLALAGAAAAEPSILETALRHEAERRGDYDALAAAWLDALPALAGDYRAELLLRRLSEIEPLLAEPLALVPALERLVGDPRLSGVAQQVAMELYVNACRRAGRDEECRRLDEGRGFLRSFQVAGPFGTGQRGLLWRRFPPETDQGEAASYAASWREISWRPLRREDPSPLIRPHHHVYPEHGAVFFLSQLHSREEREATLFLGGRGLKLWLNGRVVVDDSRASGFLPNRRAAAIHLEKGWNRILLETASPFWLRLGDVEGRPFPAGTVEEAGAERLAGTRLHPLPAAARGLREGELEAGAAPLWEAELASGPAAPALEHLGLALLHRFYERHELAVARAERALELEPEDLFIQHHAGTIFREAAYLPANLAKNRAKSACEKTLELDPAFLPAHERMAGILEEDEQLSQAAARLAELLEREPSFLAGQVRLAKIFSKRRWEADERRVNEKIAVLAPHWPESYLAEARRYEERGNNARAIELFRRAYELDRRQADLTQKLAQLEKARGRLDEAESWMRERLRLGPDDEQAAGELAELLSSRGKHDEAVALLESRTRRRPWSPGPHRALATALERAGRPQEAEAGRRLALELAPGDLELRAYFEAQSGAGGAFWAPYDEELEDWLARVPASGPLVDKAKAILVLDITVVKVESDGSSREYVHQASKLLSEEGKERLAEVGTPGEIILLRTLLPGGEVLEPVAALGKRSFVMPGLAPGVVTEHAYVVQSKEAGGKPFHNGPFFFQDFNLEQAFLLSRYIIILPPGLPSELLENGFAGDPGRLSSEAGAGLARVEKRESLLEDGSRVIVYEAREVPRLELERLMPSRQEYIPNLEVAPRRDWEDVGAELRERVALASRPTPEIERAAAEALRGIESPLEKAKALYRYASELVPEPRGSSEAVRVLLEKRGDRTALFKALLDQAGVPSTWAFLRPAEELERRVDWSFPSAALFPWSCVLVAIPGEEPVWVSLHHRQTPFGRLPEVFSGGKAFVLGPRGDRIALLPPIAPEAYATSITGVMRLGDGLDVALEIELIARSAQTYAQKDVFRTLPGFQKTLLAQRLAGQMFPGARFQRQEIRNLDSWDEPLTFSYALTAPQMLKASGGDLLLRPVPSPALLVRAFGGAAERRHPFHLDERGLRVARDRLRIEPGSAYRLERLPADVALAGALGVYSLAFELEGDVVIVERQLTLTPGRLEPVAFRAFIDFCERVDAAERESIVWRRRG